MKTGYDSPELQEAFKNGRDIGRVEGMIKYQQHLIKNIRNDNDKLSEKYKKMKSK